MADLADLTAKNDFTEEVLARRKNSLPAAAVPRGKCLNCGESVEHLYCDADCRADYEYEQSLGRRK